MHTLAVLLFAVSVVTASPTSLIVAGNDTEKVLLASPASPIVPGNDTEDGSPILRIVGGNEVPDGKYPYQVTILHKFSPTCGGSIINSRFILTAAHCIYNKNRTFITVLAGTNFCYLNHGGVSYAARSLMWHSAYNESIMFNDIGLIEVDKKIQFSSKIQPIVLASTNYVPEYEIAVVAGCGTGSSTSSVVSATLQEINTTIMSNSMCASFSWFVTRSHICTYTTLNKGVCYGDSGSPVVLNGVQIGIVSYGTPCAVGDPDVYTRVYTYTNWIELMTRYVDSESSIGSHDHVNKWSLLLLAISTLVSYSYSLS